MKTPAFVAEISGNHLGKMARAEALIDLAATHGADAVKLQTYNPRRLVGDKKLVLENGPWKGRKLIDLYLEAWTPTTWQRALFARIREHGMVPFSSPFSPADVDFLEGLKCPIYKIASFEITDLELVRYAAQTGKEMVISTGMATLCEIEEAVGTALAGGAKHVTILKCTSGYPTPLEETNAETVRDLMNYFGFGEQRISVGLSDHTLGSAASVAAIAMGAAMIEKHLTISRGDGGPDAAFSAEPHEFKQMVEFGREVQKTVGTAKYGPTPSEEPQLKLRRALWIVADVASGEMFSTDNLRSCRPCLGEPMLPIDEYLGQRATQPLKAGTLFRQEFATPRPGRNL